MAPAENAPSDGAEIDLFELAYTIFRSWKYIVLISGVCLVGAVIYALSLPNIYKSEAILAPAEGNNSAQMAGQLGGIANLAGISLGMGAADSEAGLALEILKSRQFFEKYIYQDVLVELMAVTSWNAALDQLDLDENIYSRETKTWLRKASYPYTPKPSVQEAYDVFRTKHFSTELKIDTGLYVVSVRHLSPTVAKEWVTKLISGINQEMRYRAISKAESSIAFLTNTRDGSSVINVNNILSSLIEEQTKLSMLASSTKDYAFEIVEPPIVPEQRDSPRRSIIVIVGTFLGGFLGVLGVILKTAISARAPRN